MYQWSNTGGYGQHRYAFSHKNSYQNAKRVSRFQDISHTFLNILKAIFHKHHCFMNNSINFRKPRSYLMEDGIFSSRRRGVYQDNMPLAFRVFHYGWPTVAEFSIFTTISIKWLCRHGVSKQLKVITAVNCSWLERTSKNLSWKNSYW